MSAGMWWAAGIAAMVAVFLVIVGQAVWRYLSRTAPECYEPGDGTDEELERRIQARFDAAWAALCEDITWGPCRWCRTPDEQCAPFTPCCSRCAERTDAHPVIERARA